MPGHPLFAALYDLCQRPAARALDPWRRRVAGGAEGRVLEVTVVATHVFCTVGDPRRALAEVFRVLRPCGTFRFLEHVRAADERAARWQDRLTPVWRWVSAGCHPNRRTAEEIEGAGFVFEERERFDMPGAGLAKPHIYGVARRPG